MVNVVQVVSDTNIGGAGRYLLNYLKYFDRERYRVTVIVPQKSMLSEFIREYDDVSLLEAPYMADKSYDKNCVKYLKALFLQIKPDILHTHASLSARIAGRKAKVPCIVATRHCIEPRSSAAKTLLKAMLNNRLCDYYVAVADAVARNLQEEGIVSSKVKVIYNGVEPVVKYSEEEIAAEREKLGIGWDEFVFGIFARLEKVKGHRYFLKAARELKRAGCQAKFLIVGDGTLRMELESMAKRFGVKENVIFTGYVKDTSLLLNVTDVNVISSESEAMSLAILEAMSLGKPSIATAVGGNPELIQNRENGLLVGTADSTSLAEAMMKMIQERDNYQRYSHNAEKRFAQKFRAEVMVENLEKFYEEAMKNVHR